MSRFLYKACWWLIPMGIGYGHFNGVSWLVNIGFVCCFILMLISLFASACLLVATAFPDSDISKIDMKALRRSASGAGKCYSLFCLLVMLLVLAASGRVFTAAIYFVVSMFAWLSLYLFLDLKDKPMTSSGDER